MWSVHQLYGKRASVWSVGTSGMTCVQWHASVAPLGDAVMGDAVYRSPSHDRVYGVGVGVSQEAHGEAASTRNSTHVTHSYDRRYLNGPWLWLWLYNRTGPCYPNDLLSGRFALASSCARGDLLEYAAAHPYIPRLSTIGRTRTVAAAVVLTLELKASVRKSEPNVHYSCINHQTSPPRTNRHHPIEFIIFIEYTALLIFSEV